jgi:hypothetical protein
VVVQLFSACFVMCSEYSKYSNALDKQPESGVEECFRYSVVDKCTNCESAAPGPRWNDGRVSSPSVRRDPEYVWTLIRLIALFAWQKLHVVIQVYGNSFQYHRITLYIASHHQYSEVCNVTWNSTAEAATCSVPSAVSVLTSTRHQYPPATCIILGWRRRDIENFNGFRQRVIFAPLDFIFKSNQWQATNKTPTDDHAFLARCSKSASISIANRISHYTEESFRLTTWSNNRKPIQSPTCGIKGGRIR